MPPSLRNTWQSEYKRESKEREEKRAGEFSNYRVGQAQKEKARAEEAAQQKLIARAEQEKKTQAAKKEAEYLVFSKSQQSDPALEAQKLVRQKEFQERYQKEQELAKAKAAAASSS